MKVLVDTNVWCDFFRGSDPHLLELLAHGLVLMHPVIRGELSMGALPNRNQTLHDLQALSGASEVKASECSLLVEERKLWGRGLQWNDVQILASVLITPDTVLWTRDRRLSDLASDMGVCYHAT